MKRSTSPTSRRGNTKKTPMATASDKATVTKIAGVVSSTSSSDSATFAEYIRVRVPRLRASHRANNPRTNGIFLQAVSYVRPVRGSECNTIFPEGSRTATAMLFRPRIITPSITA